ALDREVGRRANLAAGSLRRHAAERHQAIATRGVELLPDAHIPAVVEMEHPPLVAMPAVPAVGEGAEVAAAGLAVQPARRAPPPVLEVAPAEPAGDRKPGLEVGEGAELGTASLDAVQLVAADRRRRLAHLDVERRRHLPALLIHAAQLEGIAEGRGRPARVA